MLEQPESSKCYNIVRNDKCECSKNLEIGQSAAEPRLEEGSETTRPPDRKVQRYSPNIVGNPQELNRND